MDLPEAVQGVSETARWPEFTRLDFCNEEYTFLISQRNKQPFNVPCKIYEFVGLWILFCRISLRGQKNQFSVLVRNCTGLFIRWR